MRQRLADITSDFVGKRHSLTLRQTPRWAQSLILILSFFGASALLASFIIRIDEVITVSGSLRPFSGTGEILAPVTATLEDVMVSEGDLVEKDQVLAIYDTRNAKINKANLNEQIALTKKSLQQNIELRKIQRASLVRAYEFSKNISSRYKVLAEQGAVSEINQLSQEKGLEDLKSQLSILDQQIDETKLQYNQRLQTLRTDLSRTQLLLDNSIVKAPISGTVFELSAKDNQIATLGETLMEIIPDNPAKAEVFVSNRDIGFVRLGQQTRVRIDAYPFTKFGDIKGSISSIGADVLEPDETNSSFRFPVVINLSSTVLNSQGLELPLKPGMSVQANLKLREKRLVSLVTDMFSKNVEGLKSLRD
jgi:HlyD family secretion protein|tara:strand:+ start:1784 stop:2875 length:1092 start_codon:yes stop_codon:yes gene_type:complete